MKISYNWLKSMIDPGLSLEETCEKLTMSGLEVEHVTAIGSIPGGLEGLVVGEVMVKEQHPNADRLSITQVDIGKEELLHIVCGAPNVAQGQKVIVAPVGATIHPVKGEPFKIKKAKIRGERSEGMICAEDEIGLGQDHGGIVILPPETPVGKPVKELYKIDNDHQIEIAIIPNRGDAISHLGVARELQALTGVRYRKHGTTSFDDRGPHRVDVQLADNKACPRYTGISLDKVKIGDSPKWLQDRLRSIGLNPINNVVDVTNFVQHEIGQPIHAFDLDKIEGQRIVVRNAAAGEKIVTLDGQERALDPEDLLICDGHRPLALAGILGGLDSGVSDNTNAVFIESAFFDPGTIRQTAKRHGLNTDSSYRFERGADPNITEYALRRVVNLLQEVAGAEPASEIVDIYPNPIPDKEISIKLDEFRAFAGHNIPKEDVIVILQNLEIKIVANNGDNLLLHVPPYRPDVDRPVDIYEEILRIYGFDSIPIPKKVNYIPSVIKETSPNKLQRKVSDYLAAQGMMEIMSNSLTSREYYGEQESEQAVAMLNPLSNEMEILRMNLLDQGLEAIAYNLNRKNNGLKFFEFGKVYRQREGTYIENQVLQLTASGPLFKEHWNTSDEDIRLSQLKGMAENALRKLNLSNAQIQKVVKAEQLSAARCKKHGIKQAVISVRIDWDRCLEWSSSDFKLEPIPVFPVVRRDLSLVVDRSVPYKEIRNIAEQAGGAALRQVDLFDVYEGEPLQSDQRSYSLALYLYNPKHTMEDKEIDAIMDKLIARCTAKLGAVIRT